MATSYLTRSKRAGSTKKEAGVDEALTKAAKPAAAKGGAPKKAAAKKTTAKRAAAKPATAKRAAAKGSAAKPAAAKSTITAAAKPAAQKRTFRNVAKESPLKGMPVAQWMKEKTSGWQAQVVERLLGLVKEVAPESTSSIKWGQPVFEANGPFAYVRPAKAHVTFGFWRGAELADPKKLLAGAGDRMTHMKITSPDQIDAGALRALIKDAVRLNREKGSPAMRSKK
jgi:hypothetical protein